MSAWLASPKVTIHIGDGFKFLATQESTYDVIITDSSDPVGPAASLFEKPYFQLLHDALSPGGHISTQGECLWLNLSLIKDLLTSTRSIFHNAEYAYTTIPTYPSGQIGFMICSKAPSRNCKIPVRDVKHTLYYNKALHSSAFVLPEFARSFLEDNNDIRPVFGRQARLLENNPPKKVLLLGSGFVARPCAEYVVRDPANQLTIGIYIYCSYYSTCLTTRIKPVAPSPRLRPSLLISQTHRLFRWMRIIPMLLRPPLLSTTLSSHSYPTLTMPP